MPQTCQYKSSAVTEIGNHGHHRHGRKEGGGCCAPFTGAAGSPSNTMWPGPRFTSIPSGVFIHPAVWPQQTWVKNWVGVVPFFLGELGPHQTQSRLGWGLPPYQVASWWSCLATTEMGRNWGAALPPFLPSATDPSSHLATTDIGRKLGAVSL